MHLPLGRTFHSRFKAPLTPSEDCTFIMKAQSEAARLIREAELIVVDEVTMLNNWLLGTVVVPEDICINIGKTIKEEEKAMGLLTEKVFPEVLRADKKLTTWSLVPAFATGPGSSSRGCRDTSATSWTAMSKCSYPGSP